MVKTRTSAQMRIDALKMGVKKAQGGCPACAEKYFELAHQHGATEQDIQRALEQATEMQGKGLSRRELIKIAVASGLALTATGLLPRKKASASSYFFGIDSNTTICCSMPLNFYIGRMGYGVYPDTSYFAFNTSMALKAGFTNVFGYWGVQGPGYRGSRSPYDWGRAQADEAWTAWEYAFVGSGYVGGETVFGDFETGFGGWGSNVGDNQAVVSGFLTELFDITPAQVWPGLYAGPYFWNGYLGGSGFSPSAPGFVFWLANAYACEVCGPCAPCTTTISDAERVFANNASQVVFGGQNPVLWQYWLTNPGCDNSGCGDWNISNQLSQSLHPAF